MRINKHSNYTGDNEKNYIKDADTDLKKLFLLSQGRIRFGGTTDNALGENISGEFQTFTSSATADAEDIVAHGLSSTPIGYIVLSRNTSGDLYTSANTANTENIYLASSSASTTYTIFLLK